MSMGASRDSNYSGKRLGSSDDWKKIDPIDNESLADIEQMLARPGGSMKWPKAAIAALVNRLRRAESK